MSAVADKVEYWTQEGQQRLYTTKLFIHRNSPVEGYSILYFLA